MKKSFYPLEKTKLSRKGLYALCILFLISVSGTLFAQEQHSYKGTVRDASGETIPGVNVIEQGTTNGTITDIDGNFLLTLPKQTATLSFSFVGYKTISMEVAAGNDIQVTLQPTSTELDALMVVGYGVKKKSDITGAIGQVEGEQMESLPISNATQALQGRVAGVNVLANSGAPGAGMNVRIRGLSTNGNGNPLYIVDGMRTTDINNIAPGDIASIEVLKDAASAAIYGAEAANGVILISTKKGGKTVKGSGALITYDFQYGFQSPDKLPTMMGANDWAKYINEQDLGYDIPSSSISTNWLDEVTSTAPMQKHYLSFSGGNEQSTYLTSISYFNQDGIVGKETSNFERITARFNGEHQVKSWLKIGTNASFTHSEQQGFKEDDVYGGIINDALLFDPSTPVTYTGALPDFVQDAVNQDLPLVVNQDGEYYGISKWVGGEIVNPAAALAIEKGKNKTNRFQGTMYGTISPIENLNITTRFGIDYNTNDYNTWFPTYYFNSERSNTNPSKRINKWQNMTWLWENFADYSITLGDQHNFKFMVGTSAQRISENWLNSWTSGMFLEDENFNQHGDIEIDGKVAGNRSEKTLNSYFGRISYNFDSKYLIDFTMRRDGTSLLSEDNRWGIFPSVSAGWIMSNEDFLADNSTISFAKLRASWGKNGSLSNLTVDQFRSLITTSGIIYPRPDGGFYTGAEPELLANPELKWETSRQIDFGIDLRFFNDRFGLSMDYFNKKTIDLLTISSPPLSVGNYAPFANAGDVVNKGFEFDINMRNYENPLTYDITLNLATLSNEVTYLNPLLKFQPGTDIGTGWHSATAMEEGQPVWYFRGYETNGIFQNQAEIDSYKTENQGLAGYDPKPGDPIVVDVNGDGLINEDDMTNIGDPHPDIILGLNLNFTFKNFDFNTFVQGSFGSDIILGFNRIDRATSNRPQFFFDDRWTGDGSTNTWFRANSTDPYAYTSDLMVFSGDYVRFKQIQLGYTLPEKLIKKMKLKKLRCYISLDDFITITDYPGMDVEAGSSNYNSQGIDRGVYPTAKKVLLGLQLSL